jgi:hypothetical protein
MCFYPSHIKTSIVQNRKQKEVYFKLGLDIPPQNTHFRRELALVYKLNKRTKNICSCVLGKIFNDEIFA